MSQPPPTLPTGSEASGLQFDFDQLINVCAKLNEPGPVEEVLNELLLHARRFVRAEAGTVFVVADDRLRFVCCQNDARPDLCVVSRPGQLQSLGALKGVTIPINESSLAGFAAVHGRPLRIDDAYALPANAPYRFDGKYDQSTGYRTHSLLVIPLMDPDGKAVGVLQLINHCATPGRSSTFRSRDQQIAMALASMAAVSVRNAKLNEALRTSHLDTIMRLSTAAEFRDDDTGQHIRRVSMYCETVARTLGHSHEFTQLMLFAAPMHDIGKLAIPDAILKKPGRLTDEERGIMQTHTVKGAQLLRGSDSALLKAAEKIAIAHHEKWDGTGYPFGLVGDAANLEGRICAIADVFDALTSKRCYKAAGGLDESFDIVVKDAGKHFDPEVARAFVNARDEIEAIYDAYHEPPPAQKIPD